jgi:hypothetical protein
VLINLGKNGHIYIGKRAALFAKNVVVRIERDIVVKRPVFSDDANDLAVLNHAVHGSIDGRFVNRRGRLHDAFLNFIHGGVIQRLEATGNDLALMCHTPMSVIICQSRHDQFLSSILNKTSIILMRTNCNSKREIRDTIIEVAECRIWSLYGE